MVRKTVSRKLMLVAGILAALVILFSQAFEKEASSLLSKIKSPKTEKQEKARDTKDNTVVVSASSDAVTSGQAVNTGDTDHTLIREIVFGQEKNTETPAVDHTILANFFKTLFRVFISPQAP